jgi:hypothetical protein
MEDFDAGKDDLRMKRLLNVAKGAGLAVLIYATLWMLLDVWARVA